MGYPVYKLLRAVNRQYPNNGFINYVDVAYDMPNEAGVEGLIDEDLRDLINETLQEVYINVAQDEVYSFPTVAGQREYALPEDCDLRDIQEVTRTFRGCRGPLAPPPGMPPQKPIYTLTFFANDGLGEMEPMEAEIGNKLTLPECTFTPPLGKVFKCWVINSKEYQPGDEVSMYADLTAVAEWAEAYNISLYIKTVGGTGILHYQGVDESEQHIKIMEYGGEDFEFIVPKGFAVSSVYQMLEIHDDQDVFLQSYTNFAPTASVRIPMAVPVNNANPDGPADNGDGGEDTPLGGE